MIPNINKHTRVTRTTATAIDHILTNSFIDKNFKTAVFKSDISDHFPICFMIPSTKCKIENKTSFIFKRIFNFDAANTFKQDLHKTNWKDTEVFTDPNEAYKAFLERLLLLYDNYFPLRKIKTKAKDLKSPWITNAIKKVIKKETTPISEIFEKNESEHKN